MQATEVMHRPRMRGAREGRVKPILRRCNECVCYPTTTKKKNREETVTCLGHCCKLLLSKKKSCIHLKSNHSKGFLKSQLENAESWTQFRWEAGDETTSWKMETYFPFLQRALILYNYISFHKPWSLCIMGNWNGTADVFSCWKGNKANKRYM